MSSGAGPVEQPEGADRAVGRAGDWLALPVPAACGVLVLLSLPLIFWGIGSYGVVGADEAFYQDISINMLESGNFFRLQSGSYQFVYDTFGNAPLQYWLRALVVSLLGETHLSMRLVSALAALLAVLATYRLVAQVADRRAALLAALLLLTNFQFLYLHSARTGELEPIVCLLLVLIADSFIRAIQEPGRSWLRHHVCLALLFNVKAPTIAIPMLAELACFVAIPMARRRAAGWLKLGVLILPVATAWHVFQAIQHREVLATLLDSIRHQASGDFAKGSRGTFAGRVAYYAGCILFGASPALLLWPAALLGQARAALGRWGADPRAVAAQRVLLIFPLATLGFYLAISKTGPWYVIHAYPFLSAWAGIWLARLGDRHISTATLAYLAAVLSLFFWLQPETLGYNPFADDAIRIPMRTGFRTLLGVSPAVGVPGLAAIGLATLLLVRRRWPRSFGPALAVSLATLFVGTALLRSLLPLAYVDHLSPIAAMAADLGERRAAGQTIPYPVELPPAHPWVVSYYFWRDHEYRLAPGGADPANPPATRFVLVGRRDR